MFAPWGRESVAIARGIVRTSQSLSFALGVSIFPSVIRTLVQTAVVSLFWVSSAHAVAPVSPPTGEIVRYGLCEQRATYSYAKPQSTAGYATTGSLRLTDTTTDVPLRRGIAFGFVWKASNLPDHPVITYRVDHPSITRPDGITLTHFEEELEEQATNGVV
jgi:hypothetical protein